MISVDEHLSRVLAAVSPLAPLEVGISDAHGCVLAEDVTAAEPLPGFDNSGMDGYAVRAADVAGATEASPVVLPVVGDVAAGSDASLRLQPGQTVRIMTGAPVPPGCDAIVPVEWTDGGIAQVRISRVPDAGAYIRRAGEDVAPGTVVLPTGSYLGASQLGLLAAVNRPTVQVRPRPRVVVLSTGSELVEVGTPLTPGRLVDSNSPALTAAVRETGGIGYRVGVVPDDPRRLADTLEDQYVRADVVVTSGGVSVGAYDVVKQVLSRVGSVQFDRVAMQPGMPQGFGTVGPDAIPLFALPGNPVSALVSFEVFVRPALRRMLGAEPLGRPTVQAVTTQGWRSPPGRRQFVRVRLAMRDGRYAVTPTGGQGSHLLAGLAAANALAVVPEEVTEVAAGDTVTAMLLERRSR